MKRCRQSGAADYASVPQTEIVSAPAALGPALELGELHGYRNAQVTVVAPTGTIGLVMDCDPPASARFRAGEIQEARAAATSKINQPRVPEARARSATRERYRGDRGLCRRPWLALQRALPSTFPP